MTKNKFTQLFLVAITNFIVRRVVMGMKVSGREAYKPKNYSLYPLQRKRTKISELTNANCIRKETEDYYYYYYYYCDAKPALKQKALDRIALNYYHYQHQQRQRHQQHCHQACHYFHKQPTAVAKAVKPAVC